MLNLQIMRKPLMVPPTLWKAAYGTTNSVKRKAGQPGKRISGFSWDCFDSFPGLLKDKAKTCKNKNYSTMANPLTSTMQTRGKTVRSHQSQKRMLFFIHDSSGPPDWLSNRHHHTKIHGSTSAPWNPWRHHWWPGGSQASETRPSGDSRTGHSRPSQSQ